MTARRQVSRAGLELIKRFEGCRLRSAQLPDGRWTVGYGHTRSARPGAEISEADAEALLIYDLFPIVDAVRGHVHAPLGQNQFDALCAFAFNVGVERFLASDVLRRINEGQPLQAAFALEQWRRAEFEGEPILIDALVRRRALEKALFLTPEAGFPAAPTPLLRPLQDDGAVAATPAEEPVEIVAAVDGDRITAERVEPAPEQPELDLAPFPYEAEAAPEALGAEPAPEAPAEAEDAPPIPSRAEDVEPVAALAADAGVEAADRPDNAAMQELKAVASPTLLWAGLAVLGLAIFAAGIFWGFSPGTAADGSVAPIAIGWGLGLIGILCVATAVYFLLDRLSGPEEEEGEP